MLLELVGSVNGSADANVEIYLTLPLLRSEMEQSNLVVVFGTEIAMVFPKQERIVSGWA